MFITLGKAGGSAMADAEAMGRLISAALRSGIPLPSIIRQLRGISSDRAVGLGPNKVLSVPAAIGIALDDWWRDKVQGVQQDAFTTAECRNSVNHRLRPARTVGRSRGHVGASRAYRTVRHPASSPGQ